MRSLLGVFACPIIRVTALFAVCAIVGCVEPRSIRVDGSTGTDAPACGLGDASPCRSVSFALKESRSGDTVLLAPGVYRERISVSVSGLDSRPTTVACSGSPGSCVISGDGIHSEPWGALVRVSASNVALLRLAIVSVPAGMYGIAIADSSRVELRDLRIDGVGSSESLIVTSGRVDRVTLVKSRVVNCPAASSGCTYWQNVSNLAVVASEFGPVAGGGNYDCNTVIGTTVGLIDGNTCRDSVDGFDAGMDEGGSALDRVVTRYNVVRGALSGRAFPVSGQYEGGTSRNQFLTGRLSIYKNVVAASGVSCFQAYGGARDVLIAANTCLTTGGYGSAVWLQTEWDAYVSRVSVRGNLFDGPDDGWQPPVVLGSVETTVTACPSSDPCPFIGNVLWMPRRADASPSVWWAPSSGGTGAGRSFSMSDWQTSWNSEAPNAGNRRIDPVLVDRSKWTDPVRYLAPSPTSSLVDTGEPFCRTTSAGAGNTVAVSCVGTSDPTTLFPVPADFYRLSSVDCSGAGARPAGSPGSGCFDVQIDGCGVRHAKAATATSVEFDGPACTWIRGAAVHVPWTGAAPDAGALESRL